jgi:hypothetical protein
MDDDLIWVDESKSIWVCLWNKFNPVKSPLVEACCMTGVMLKLTHPKYLHWHRDSTGTRNIVHNFKVKDSNDAGISKRVDHIFILS